MVAPKAEGLEHEERGGAQNGGDAGRVASHGGEKSKEGGEA